jgi:lysophospholipase L1-like esterase
MLRRLASISLLVLWWLCPPAVATEAESKPKSFPVRAERILFLGDSITHAGTYITRIETQLRLAQVEPLPEIINLGLPSETCSGLSEPDHPFPRPGVHERLQRALDKTRPDVVVACYGMNDGIYHPFSDERFRAYQEGIGHLIERVHACGAKLVLLTPPPFDPLPLRDTGKLRPEGDTSYSYRTIHENYDEVLVRYSEWLIDQSDRVAMVIDLHTPLSVYVNERRKKDADYTLSPDGIHPNDQGHRLISDIILRAWDVVPVEEVDPQLLDLVQERTALVHASWLSKVGHQRPGIPPGLSLDEARLRADELDRRIRELLTREKQRGPEGGKEDGRSE